MKAPIQPYAIFVSIIASLTIHSAGYAQDTPSQSEIISTAVTYSKSSDTMTPASRSKLQTSSWQGEDLALRGRDVVSYHQSDKPLKGSKKYAASWDSTTWRFASEENRDLFIEDPERYVPEFGGFCPVALSKNHAKVGLSKHYTVVDEKLYLNYNKEARQEFRETPKEYIVRAQLNF